MHVIYGVVGLKTHAKMCLVIRREPDGVHCYVHLSTGNYNTVTSRIYTDLSYFTCDPAMGADTVDLFNALTGYARQDTYRKLLVAPGACGRSCWRALPARSSGSASMGTGIWPSR